MKIQTNLEFKDKPPILERIFRNLLDDTFKICIDPLFPPPYPMKNISRLKTSENYYKSNGYELIFDETEDKAEM